IRQIFLIKPQIEEVLCIHLSYGSKKIGTTCLTSANLPPCTPGLLSSHSALYTLPPPPCRPGPHYPRHTARILGGQNPKKKNVLSILEKAPPAKKKSKEHFFFLGLPSGARWWWGFRGAYNLI